MIYSSKNEVEWFKALKHLCREHLLEKNVYSTSKMCIITVPWKPDDMKWYPSLLPPSDFVLFFAMASHNLFYHSRIN